MDKNQVTRVLNFTKFQKLVQHLKEEYENDEDYVRKEFLEDVVNDLENFILSSSYLLTAKAKAKELQYGWIPLDSTKQGTPPFKVPVLCYCPKDVKVLGHPIVIAELEETTIVKNKEGAKTRYIWFVDEGLSIEPTHWLPLPTTTYI